jgi:hypothetical protein
VDRMEGFHVAGIEMLQDGHQSRIGHGSGAASSSPRSTGIPRM